jgi:hypothetical protein
MTAFINRQERDRQTDKTDKATHLYLIHATDRQHRHIKYQDKHQTVSSIKTASVSISSYRHTSFIKYRRASADRQSHQTSTYRIANAKPSHASARIADIIKYMPRKYRASARISIKKTNAIGIASHLIAISKPASR